MLARIHAVDPAAVGLVGFGRPDGYLGRQLSRWQRQWKLCATRDLPGYDTLVDRLAAGLPPSAEGTLVHGDFRLDNTLVTLGARPAIAAVVDWELSTLGDPLADLGLTMAYWADRNDPDWLRVNVGAAATALPGFFTAAQFATCYSELQRPGCLGHRLLHGLRLLQAGRRPGEHPRALPEAPDGGRGIRAGGTRGPGADRPGAPVLDSSVI